MTLDKLVYALLLWNLLTMLGFGYWVTQLLNRVMSRSFYEYEVAKTVGQAARTPPQPEIKLPSEPLEDLNHLAGYGTL